MQLEGIHHITGITGDARQNLDFYTRVLGLRLAAKTVNQDDPSVYHLFYADELGRPGAELTFFEYPRALPGRAGAGMVHTIVWRVGGSDALDFWAQQLGDEGIDVQREGERLRFEDFEGLRHELAVNATADAPLAAEHPEIPAALALQGFDSVRAYSVDPERSRLLLERVLGATPAGDGTWELRGKRRGGTIAYDPAPPQPGRQSAGVIHHVAWGTTVAEHPRWQEHLNEAGVRTSGIIDRHYFHSIYSASPAASCSRSPTTALASRSTCRSRSSARRSSCRRSSRPTATRSRRG